MKKTFAVAALCLSGLFATMTTAETCGGIHVVKSGESLSIIADKHYKNAGKWSAIHSANLNLIGPKPNLLQVGMKLSLSCINGRPTGLAGGTEVTDVLPTSAKLKITPGHAAVRSRINLLTGDDYAPFAAKDAPNGGLITELVTAAMTAASPKEGFAVHWVDDWASHFDPLLSNALLDIGFPWYQPDCTNSPDEYRCQNFHFSDAMFEELVLVFTEKSRSFVYNTDADMEGKTLCRPDGYFTFDLNQDGRNWLKENKITLKQPKATKACFEMLLEGEVDAVVLVEFQGREMMGDMQIQDRIRVLPQPLAIVGEYVVVHKSHPQAEYMMGIVNDGLRKIRASGDYQTIVEKHLTQIWAAF